MAVRACQPGSLAYSTTGLPSISILFFLFFFIPPYATVYLYINATTFSDDDDDDGLFLLPGCSVSACQV